MPSEYILRAQALDDHVSEVVLKILCHPRHKRHSNRRQQQQSRPMNKLRLRVVVVLGGVSVDHVAKNEWVKQGKYLVGRG